MKKIILFLCFISILWSKPVLLNVQKSGCGWCAKMDREVFQNPSVMKKLKKKFKVILMNKDFDEEDIPSFIHVRFYPTTYVLDEKMSVVLDELPGYMSAHDILNYFDLLDYKD